jgi:hypothetical protein
VFISEFLPPKEVAPGINRLSKESGTIESRDRRDEEVFATLRHHKLRNRECLSQVVWAQTVSAARCSLADDGIDAGVFTLPQRLEAASESAFLSSKKIIMFLTLRCLPMQFVECGSHLRCSPGIQL